MTRVRAVSLSVTQDRYRELVYFCRQYPHKRGMLNSNIDTVGSVVISDMPSGGGWINKVEELAIKRASWAIDCDMIVECAKVAGGSMWEYIIRHVCYDEGYDYLRLTRGMPCGKGYFYKIRRDFFMALNEKRI